MEDQGTLDPSNEHHIAALHYVFLPIINRHLMLIMEGHNRGPISTEHNIHIYIYIYIYSDKQVIS